MSRGRFGGGRIVQAACETEHLWGEVEGDRAGKGWVIYDFQAANRREGGNTSCRGRSREAPGLHLERARDRAGGSRIAWRADYWRGECPAWGWWWKDS